MTFLDKLQDFLGLTPDPPIKYKVTITEAPPSSDETIAQALENLKMRVKKTQAAERAAKAAKEAAEKDVAKTPESVTIAAPPAPVPVHPPTATAPQHFIPPHVAPAAPTAPSPAVEINTTSTTPKK